VISQKDQGNGAIVQRTSLKNNTLRGELLPPTSRKNGMWTDKRSYPPRQDPRFFLFEKQDRGHRRAYLSLRFKIGSPSCLATLKMT
jgi:hypothetical protein